MAESLGLRSDTRYGWSVKEGKVVAICLAPVGEASLVQVQEVRAVPGRGLEGDRYFEGTGTYYKRPDPSREVTFIERESLDAISREAGIDMALEESRRNVVTEGVPLNHLVDEEFHFGEVSFRGIRLCEPCDHMEKLSGKPGAREALLHRGGLRAQILTEGVIRVGDRFTG
jgi:MOSC domain-containing protein YiiM